MPRMHPQARVIFVDARAAARLWAADRRDFLVCATAVAATATLGVTLGVAAAVALSLVAFLALTTQPRVEELGRLSGTVVYRHLGLVGVAPLILADVGPPRPPRRPTAAPYFLSSNFVVVSTMSALSAAE